MPTKKEKKLEQTGELSDQEVDDYIKGIENGSIAPTNLSKKMYYSISNRLKEALYAGFGKNLYEASLGEEKDFELLKELRTNVYMFGAAKNYQQTKDISSLLIDPESGAVRTSKEFNALARQSYSNWNNNWGETEYSTAYGQGQAAVKWQMIEQEKNVLPNLRYSSIGDACPICLPLDGIVAPVDAKIWNQFAPLNHFNCRCILLQEDETVKLSSEAEVNKAMESGDKLIQPTFKSNPAKDGMIFNEHHPYFEVSQEDKAFAKNNFDMPIPKDDGKKLATPEPAPVKEKKPRKKREPKTVEPTAPGFQTANAANEGMEKWLLNNGKPVEMKAIGKYTSSEYADINRGLRAGRDWSEAENSPVYYKDLVGHMDSFIAKAPKCDFVTYRGLGLPDEKFAEYFKMMKPGAIIKDNGYMSTSASPSIARDFSAGKDNKTFIQVRGKSGVYISNISELKREEEVVFAHGTEWKVLKAEKKLDSVSGEYIFHVTIEEQ